MSMANEQNLTPFKPGNPGGPGRKRKNIDVVAAIQAALEQEKEVGGKYYRAIDAIVITAIADAVKGDDRARRFLFDYGFGKPRQVIDLNPGSSVPVTFTDADGEI
ncbi:MAG: DUF5681 domain-containing protein, partial [Notoacmeibacter sp.]